MAAAHKSKNVKTDILLSALRDAPFDGWNDALLEKAAKKNKISAAETARLFPAGARDLAVYFSEWADDQALAKLTPAKLKNLKVREKIALGARTRLEIMAPHKAAAQTALTFMALPPRSLWLPKMVWRTADRLWLAAGDTATDYNHYTKRLLLSGVLTSTALYWLNDQSAGHEKTWAFLGNRIDNVLKLGQKISAFRKKA